VKHISSSIEELIEALEIEPDDEPGAEWIGDPWSFDVECENCHHIFPGSSLYCPRCDSEEAIPLEH
jgi:hypothetical protein